MLSPNSNSSRSARGRPINRPPFDPDRPTAPRGNASYKTRRKYYENLIQYLKIKIAENGPFTMFFLRKNIGLKITKF